MVRERRRRAYANFAHYRIVNVRKRMPCFLSIDGRREAADENGFLNASFVKVRFVREDVEIC